MVYILCQVGKVHRYIGILYTDERRGMTRWVFDDGDG